MNQALRISRALIEEMVEHCRARRPNEACGVLASRDGEVVKIFRMRNASASPLRYSLDPREQLAVYRKLEDDGCELGAVFHSHTRTPAYPSPTDVRLASEDVPYVIVSLAREEPDINAFRIIKDNWTDPQGDVVEVPVIVTG